MNRKALFFDVDGTLLSEINHTVPDSTVSALSEARKQGHLVFINSGRVFCHIGPIRKLVEADGYLCGCGTHVIVEEEVLYAHRIAHDRGIQIKKDIVRYGFDGILEGKESCYCRRETSWIPEIEHLRTLLAQDGHLSPFGWEEDCYEYDKFCIWGDENSDRAGLFQSLQPDITIIDRGDDFYECVPAGHSKATAIAMILQKYGMSRSDAYVFGDSTNDLTMFEYAENAILMGNHSKELEPYATFITKTVEDDGIAYAMKKLGLIC
ncbi:MAG: HAD family hydrolase [Hungatella sp.]